MADYSLALFGPVKGSGSTTLYTDLTYKAKSWQRSINANGGAWDGSFRIEGPLYELQDWFYNRIGWHIMEIAGGITWAGMIYEMDLVYQGASRRRSLDDVYNYVDAWFGDGTSATAAAQDATSVARFGRKEGRLTLTNFPQTAAESQRDLYLRQHAYPWPRPLTASATSGDNYLDVTVLGYWKTMDWRFTSVAPGGDADVSVWLDNILDADCADYLTVGGIDANTIHVTQTPENDERAWATLKRLVDLGGNSGGVAYPWRIWVDNQRRVFYRQIDTTPLYAIRDDGIYPYAGGTKVSPRQVVPGVMRDMRYPLARTEAGSWLADGRDTWIERVEVDAEGRLRLNTLEYDPEEILQAQLAPRYAAEAEARRAREEAEARADLRRQERGREHWKDLTDRKERTKPDEPGWKWTGDDWEKTDEPYL